MKNEVTDLMKDIYYTHGVEAAALTRAVLSDRHSAHGWATRPTVFSVHRKKLMPTKPKYKVSFGNRR